MRENAKPDGFKYWEYHICYVDDVLVNSYAQRKVVDVISKRYTLNEGDAKKPDVYLGVSI